MMRELSRHRTAYLILTLALGLFIVGFNLAWPNILLQRALVLFLGSFYFFWGVIEHRKSGVVSVRLVLEYFFVSVLACSLLLMLTL